MFKTLIPYLMYQSCVYVLTSNPHVSTSNWISCPDLFNDPLYQALLLAVIKKHFLNKKDGCYELGLLRVNSRAFS